MSLVRRKLKDDGISYYGQTDPVALYELVEFLCTCQVWNAHVEPHATVPPRPFTEVSGKGEWPMFCHSMTDMVRAPYFFEYALSGFDVARDYFGETPRLYSMNCFWTQPASTQYADTHSWHRDADDRKQLAMFLYGTDVIDLADGAHMYQRGTHRLVDGSVDHLFNDASSPQNPAPLINAAQAIMDAALGRPADQPPPGVVTTMTGPAGTTFFTDPCGLHMGVRPVKPRMFAWARWGVSTLPASYVWDHMSPVDKSVLGDRYPTDPAMQEVVRLVVA